jgi:hypothetical protein
MFKAHLKSEERKRSATFLIKYLLEADDEYGWERYRKAGIKVIDTQTGELVIYIIP